jgi:hypothetical protein
MSETTPGSDIPPLSTTQPRTNRVAIAAILAVTIILLACVLACASIVVVFLFNAPWG